MGREHRAQPFAILAATLAAAAVLLGKVLTRRSEKVPGYDAYVVHVFGHQRGREIQPQGCADYHTSTAPSTLLSRGLTAYSRGAPNGQCRYGVGNIGYEPPPPRRRSHPPGQGRR